MQVSNGRNTGKINHNSRHLDHLISFCKFVQVHLRRNITTKSYKTHWLFSAPETFIYTHFPEDKDDQLVSLKVSKKKFVELPSLRQNFFDAVHSCSYKIERINKCTGNIIIDFKMNDSYAMIASVFSLNTGEYVNGCWKVTANDGDVVMTVTFPERGKYKVNLFVKNGKAGKSEWCGEFLVVY